MTTQTTTNLSAALGGGSTTIEQILLYAGAAYNYIHGNSQYKELEPSGVDTGNRPIAFLDVTQTSAGMRAIIRASVPVSADWTVTDGNLWVKAQEISTGTLPQSFNVTGL